MIDRQIRLDQRPQASGSPTALRSILTQSSSPVGRFLLAMAIILLPLQNTLPAVAGMSIMFLVYGVLAAYILVNRPRSLAESWCHPIFIAAYAFIGVSALLEFSSPLSRYEEIIRFAEMIGGAVCVATLCRDRASLTACLYGYIATGLWVAVVLFSTGYDTLQGMQASNFEEASKVRGQAFGNKTIGGNINGMAFICTQGALVAFALSLSDRFKYLRIPLVGIAGFCLTASFLPMSRGAAVVSLASFVIILYAHGVKHGMALIFIFILGVGVYAVVPDATWSRMVYSTERRDSGKMEARASLYDAALNRLPEYIVAGVGAGNFSRKWGIEKGFAKHRSEGWIAQPTHNSPLQITINWGILGLVMFLWIIWLVYRSVPLHCGRDELSLALLGIMVSVGLFLLQTHGFYAKEFSFSLGMLVGSRLGIWPTGIVSAIGVSKSQSGIEVNTRIC